MVDAEKSPPHLGTCGHGPTLREFGIDTGGLWVGDILSNFHAVLRGTPTLVTSEDQQKS